MKNIFICFPLTHPDEQVFKQRVEEAKRYCWGLIQSGNLPLSPALVGLDILTISEEKDISFDRWEEFCYGYLSLADEVHVLKLKGWDQSKGVEAEIKKAEELGKVIWHISKENI